MASLQEIEMVWKHGNGFAKNSAQTYHHHPTTSLLNSYRDSFGFAFGIRILRVQILIVSQYKKILFISASDLADGPFSFSRYYFLSDRTVGQLSADLWAELLITSTPATTSKHLILENIKHQNSFYYKMYFRKNTRWTSRYWRFWSHPIHHHYGRREKIVLWCQ